MLVLVFLPLFFPSHATETISYRFSTSDSQSFYDYSRHDNHGTNGKTTTSEIGIDVSLSTFGASFSGTGTMVTLPPNDMNTRIVDAGTEFTVVAWIYPSSLSGMILTRKDPIARLFGIDLTATGISVVLMDTPQDVSWPSLAVATWKMLGVSVLCTATDCTVSPYLDTALGSLLTFTPPFADSVDSVFELSTSNPLGGFAGVIYEFRWFDTALTQISISGLITIPPVGDPCVTLYTMNPTACCLPVVTSPYPAATPCPATCATTICEMSVSLLCFATDSTCHKSCFTCFGPANTQCDTCKDTRMAYSSGTCTCPAGMYTDTDGCIACYSGCKTCTDAGADKCSDCNAPAVLSTSKTCDCPAGMYMTNSATCKACSSECKSCSGDTTSDCLTCFTNAEILGLAPFGPCVCSLGFFGVPSSCQSCDPVCLECSSLAVCVSCQANAHISGLSCMCDGGFYPVPDARNCVACDPTCAECVNSGPLQCSKCVTNAVLVNAPISACQCTDGFYPDPDPSLCSACNSDCLKCSLPGAAQCQACKPYASLSGGTPSSCVCDPGYAGPASSCQVCDPTCVNCSNALPSGCDGCHPNASLIGGVGPSACLCDAGYFPNPTAGNCSKCDITCTKCTGPGTNNCAECYPGAHIDSGTNQCVCDSGLYPNPTSQACAVCFVSCQTCSGSGQNGCQTCKDASVTPVSGFCACGTNQYLLVSGTCANCHPSCQTCSAGTLLDCSTCHPDASFVPGTGCQCDSGFAGSPATCQACDPGCLTCSVPTICLSCKTNAYIVPGSPGVCVCVPGYYPSPGPENCLQCDLSCLTCATAGTSSCLTCYPNASTSSPTPSPCRCNPGYLPNPSLSTCALCHSTCLACLSPNSISACSDCYLNAELSGTAPSLCACKLGFYPSPDAQSCLACPGLCATCLDGSGVCVSCKANSGLVVGGCGCNLGYYVEGGGKSCGKCHFSCRSCGAAGVSSCLACEENSTLVGAAPSSCACNPGYSRDGTTLRCIAVHCDIGCTGCSSAGTCLGCHSNAHILPGDKLCTCQSGYFPSPNASNCFKCHPQCLNCANPTASGCVTCKQSAALSGNWPAVCVCKYGYFPDPDPSNCIACPPNCAVCQDSKSCEQCALGYFPLGAICFSCTNDCLHCTNTQRCDECAPGFYPNIDKRCKVCPTCPSPLLATTSGPDSNNTYIITFNRNVTNQFYRMDISLFTVPETDMHWEIQQGESLVIKVSGGPWTDINSVFLSFVVLVRDEFGFFLSNPDLTLPPPVDFPINIDHNQSYTNATIATLAIASVSVLGGGAIVAGASLAGGNIAMALLSQMQYFSYIGSANFTMTGTMGSFYTNLNQQSTLPNFFKKDAKNTVRRLENSDKMTDLRDFLDSSGQYLTILTVIALVHFGVFVVNFGLKGKCEWIERIKHQFVWSVYLYFWYFAYLDLQISALFQLKQSYSDWSDVRTTFCNLVSLFVLTATVITPFSLFFLIYKWKSLQKTRFSSLISSLRPDHPWSKYLIPVYYAQRFLYSLLIVYLHDSPTYQSALLIIPCGLMTIFVVISRPMQKKTSRIVHILGEIAALLVYTLLCFATFRYSAPEIDLCWAIVALTLMSFSCTLVIFGIEIGTSVREKCRKTKELTQVSPFAEVSVDGKTSIWGDGGRKDVWKGWEEEVGETGRSQVGKEEGYR